MSRLLSLALLLSAAGPAAASYIPVDFSAHHNLRIQNLQGSAALFPSGSVTLGGVPFAIQAVGPNAWSAASAPGPNPRLIDISVGVFGVDSVHMLINTLWGETVPGTRGRVEFYGSDGAMFTWFLDGDDDVRDYLLNTFTNSINNTTTTNVFTAGAGIQNRVRLDMLTLDLPPVFLTQTLDRIRVVDNGVNAGAGPNPQRLLVSGITVNTAVPEPSTFVLLGLASVAAVIYRRKRTLAASTACAVGLCLFTGTASAQSPDEVKRLNERIELLETKLKLAEREKEDLKKENEDLRAKAKGDGKKVDPKQTLSDRLTTGAALKGDWRFVNRDVSGSATLTVTERKGDTVKAVYSVPGAKPGEAGNDQEMTGTISGNSVSLKSVSAPKPFTLKGDLKDDYLNLTFDGPAGKATMKLK